jgi:hypothetical protein
LALSLDTLGPLIDELTWSYGNIERLTRLLDYKKNPLSMLKQLHLSNNKIFHKKYNRLVENKIRNHFIIIIIYYY